MTELDALVAALRGAQRSVFRLEARQHYGDDPQWQAYVAGERWQDNADLAAWCDLVRANTARGVSMQRVHVVTQPWSPYVHFEVEQHYPFNQGAGEGVRLVHAAEQWNAPDFWLVDDRCAWLLDYDPDGTMTVVRATEQELPTLREWRDRAVADTAAGVSSPLPA